MAGSFSIQQLDQSNYPLLVPLMKDCFGMDVSADYFKWKYFDNPAGPCVGFLAIDKNSSSAVSFYGAIPQKYIVEGKEVSIYQACDVMTHTKYRKKSLYPVLARECYNYLQDHNSFFMLAIGGTDQSIPVLTYFGWKQLFYFRNYFKPKILCRSYFLRNYPSDRFITGESPETLGELITHQHPSSKIRSPRTIGHYKWRISNPNFSYQVVSYRDKGKITGFVVYYISYNKIVLFDFVFTNASARKALLWFLSKNVVKNNYEGIICFCQPGEPQSLELKKGGFVSNPFNKGPLSYKPPFMIHGEDETVAKFADPCKWSLTAYDYDAS